MRRTTSHFSGHVQGVGFRYTVMNIAQSFNVVGFVRNLPGGDVELVVEGPDSERIGLVEEITRHMGEYVSEVRSTDSAGTGEFSRFTIVH